jgi:hypothetical protein
MDQFILIPQVKFDELSQKLDKALAMLGNGIKPIKIEDWIPEKEAQTLLGLKATSLWALRKQGQLKSSKIGSKTFYSLKSIEKLLNKNQE